MLKKSGPQLPLLASNLKNLIRQFLTVVAFLHFSPHIFHGDLKPGNVLIAYEAKASSPGEGDTIRLCDFGSALFIGRPPAVYPVKPGGAGPVLLSGGCGTAGYRAPEVDAKALTDGYEPYAADVYAAGKTLEFWLALVSEWVRRGDSPAGGSPPVGGENACMWSPR